MANKMNEVFNKATDYSGTPGRKIGKGILGGVIVLLLGAFGLEMSNKDFDLGSLLSGVSAKDSKIERDDKGNLSRDASGNFITKIMRDKEGYVIPTGQAGGKYTNEYNCKDFATQPEAQRFFINAGGKSKDTNGLDGDNDGVACEDLPKGSNSSSN